MGDFLDLSKKQVSLFVDNNLGYVEALITCDVPKKIMVMCYCILVRQKNVKRIEELPIDQKTNLWETAKDFSKGRLNNEGLIKLSKCLYILEYFLNLQTI